MDCVPVEIMFVRGGLWENCEELNQTVEKPTSQTCPFTPTLGSFCKSINSLGENCDWTEVNFP